MLIPTTDDKLRSFLDENFEEKWMREACLGICLCNVDKQLMLAFSRLNISGSLVNYHFNFIAFYACFALRVLVSTVETVNFLFLNC